jgi:(2Fe-2S) ferredoxin
VSRFRCHFFICINRRADGHPKGCCASKGSEDIAAAIKLAAYDAGLKGVVRVNKAGCLDSCENGVSAVVYPQGVWYRHITLDDVDEIVQRTLIAGEIIDRLVLPTTPSEAADTSPPTENA